MAESSGLSASQKRQALASVLGHETLRNSPSVKKFLSYVVDKHLADPAASIKGYTIAVEGFGKPANFDPQDPYIRNLAREVRRALDRYYQSKDVCDPVQIEIPLGTYSPLFRSVQTNYVRDDTSTYTQTNGAIALLEKMEPTLAVIPFKALVPGAMGNIYGELIADELISRFSHSEDFQVISLLSTLELSVSNNVYSRAKQELSADYIVYGTYLERGGHLRVSLQVTEVRSSPVTQAAVVNVSTKDIATGVANMADRLLAEIHEGILNREFKRGITLDPLTLDCFTLKISAMRLMHRSSRNDLKRSWELLKILLEKQPRGAEPHALMGHWHILNHNQGWGSSQGSVARNALECADRALNSDPECSLALTIDAVVAVNFFKDFKHGIDSFDRAIEANPNNALAWLLKGTMHTFQDQGDLAVRHTGKARHLSPLDPHTYYYDSIHATAEFVAGNYEQALKLMESSYRMNKHHASTLRVRTMLFSTMGRLEEAAKAAQELLELNPDFTVSTYRDNFPAPNGSLADRCCNALLEAGIPK